MARANKLMMHPGFGVAGEFCNRGRELSFHDVGEGYGLEDGAQVGADGDPDLLQVLCRALILDSLGPLAPDVCEGSFHGADDGGERDLLRRQREPVAARGAAPGTYDPRAFQVVKYVLHELLGDALGLRDPIPLYGARVLGRSKSKLGGRPERIVGLGRNLQATSRSLEGFGYTSWPQPSSSLFSSPRFGT